VIKGSLLEDFYLNQSNDSLRRFDKISEVIKGITHDDSVDSLLYKSKLPLFSNNQEEEEPEDCKFDDKQGTQSLNTNNEVLLQIEKDIKKNPSDLLLNIGSRVNYEVFLNMISNNNDKVHKKFSDSIEVCSENNNSALHLLPPQNSVQSMSTNNKSSDSILTKTNVSPHSYLSQKNQTSYINFLINFKYKGFKKENIDKIIIRKFLKYIKHLFTSNNANEILSSFGIDEDFAKEFNPIKFLPPLKSDRYYIKSFGSQYLKWLFSNKAFFCLYPLFSSYCKDELSEYIIEKHNLREKTGKIIHKNIPYYVTHLNELYKITNSSNKTNTASISKINSEKIRNIVADQNSQILLKDKKLNRVYEKGNCTLNRNNSSQNSSNFMDINMHNFFDTNCDSSFNYEYNLNESTSQDLVLQEINNINHSMLLTNDRNKESFNSQFTLESLPKTNHTQIEDSHMSGMSWIEEVQNRHNNNNDDKELDCDSEILDASINSNTDWLFKDDWGLDKRRNKANQKSII